MSFLIFIMPPDSRMFHSKYFFSVWFGRFLFFGGTNTSTWAGCDIRLIFKRCLTGFNSEFFFSLTGCLTKAKKPSLPYHLPIAGRRIIGFISFPKVLVLCEMQSASARIWTHVAMSISYKHNHYTTGSSSLSLSLSLSLYIYIYIYVTMCVLGWVWMLFHLNLLLFLIILELTFTGKVIHLRLCLI